MVPQLEMCLSEGWIKPDCRHQGVCQRKTRLQPWMCRDEEGNEKFPLFPDEFCAACPRIQPQQLSVKSHLQENQEKMEDPEGTWSSASTCIYVQALKSFLTMRLFPPILGTIRGILRISPSSLLPSATTCSGRVSWWSVSKKKGEVEEDSGWYTHQWIKGKKQKEWSWREVLPFL